jgi:predicted  nucleic acid-binding Zn-ribbon protein
MEDVLDNLVRIQELDDEIKSTTITINNIPQTIINLEKEIEKLNNNVQNNRNRIQEIKKQYKMKEGDLAENENKINKLNSQTFAVKTNEEYRAILSEVDYLKKENKKIEDEMINLLEEEEWLKNTTNKLEQETKEHIDDKTNEIVTLKKNKEELIEKQEQAKMAYEEHFNKLPQDIQEIYERISNVRDRAVCLIAGNTCTGCYANLTHQLMNELRKRNKILLCDHCGRILVFKKNS